MNLAAIVRMPRWASRSPLWRKQAMVISALVTSAMLAFGSSEMIVSYGEARTQIGLLQQSQAREVAQALRGSLANIERHVDAVTVLPLAAYGWFTLETRREEYARLLRLVPAVESVAFHDDRGHELLMVSRREPDRQLANAPMVRVAPQRAVAGRDSVYGDVEYVQDYEPYLLLNLEFQEAAAQGRTLVRVALRALARELAGPLRLAGAEVYVVDRSGTIVLHQDPSVMLERRAVTLASLASGGSQVMVADKGLRGVEVLRSVERLEQLKWQVVVEQPLDEAMRPVWATLQRTGMFMLIGLVLSALSAVYLAGRLTRPIRQLYDGVQSLGTGSLDTRVTVNTRDELQTLAERFNAMADSVQESHNTLEARVTEKTHALELANQRKTEFLANMSHELRTPLNAIIVMSDQLAVKTYGELNTKQLEYARDIYGSGDHLLSLINELLDLSKIEAGRVELDLAEFDIAAAVDGAMMMVRDRCRLQHVDLRRDLSPSLSTWVADEQRFRQILVNLLSNAVKFTAEGGTVSVHARLQDEQLVVAVSDTGVGIAEADVPLIFEPFRQVGAKGGKAEGTGLGLSLVRSLVTAQQGSIEVRSQPGVGSTFEFRLPKAKPRGETSLSD